MTAAAQGAAAPVRCARGSDCERPPAGEGLPAGGRLPAGEGRARCSARRFSGATAAGRAAAVLSALALAVGLLAAPQAVLAQTSSTLVSNTGTPVDTNESRGKANEMDLGQAFTTGTSSGGYKLTSVDLAVALGTQNLPMPTYRVEIWTDSGGSPSAMLGRLANPATLVGGTNTFTAPGTGIDLKPNTTYHVVWDLVVPTLEHDVRRDVFLRNTSSDAEDSGAAAGWSIANTSRRKTQVGSVWIDENDSRRIAIKGYDDTTAPTFSSAAAMGTVLVLTYDEPLDESSVPAGSDFIVKVGGSAVSLATSNPVAVAGTTVTLTLAAAVGSTDTVTVSYTAGTNPLQDNAGNDVAGLTDQAATIDSTAPSLLAAVLDGTMLTLSYGETLDENSVPAGSAFTVTVDGTAVALAASNPVTISDTTVTVMLANPVHGGQTATMTYAVPSSNPIQDMTANAAAALTDHTIIVTDSTPPILVSAVVDVTELTLTYNEALDANSLPAAAAFEVTVGTATAVNPSQVAIAGRTVTLTLATGVTISDTVTLSYTSPAQNPLQDTGSGNLAASYTDWDVTVTDTVVPVFQSASVEGAALTLTYNEALDANSAPPTTAYTVTVDGTAAETLSVSVTGSTVTLTLAGVVFGGQLVTVSYSSSNSAPIRDLSANNAADLSSESATVVDTVPPVLVYAEVVGTALMLNYNEPLSTTAVPSASSFAIRVAGAQASLAATDPVVVSGSAVVLTLAEAVDADSIATVTYAVATGSRRISDAAGNHAAEFDTLTVIVTAVDTTAPTVSAATVFGTKLTLTYDEPLDGDSTPAATAFSVTVNSGTAANPSSVAVAGSTVTLTLASAVSSSDTVTVSYTVPSANPLQDTVGNAAAALTDRSVTVKGAAAPVLSRAEVARSALTLTYDEVLDEASVPPGSAFTVNVDGSEVSLAAIAAPVAVSGAAVTLMLADPVLSAARTVTVSYAVPTANPIQDPDSNAAAALTDQAVTVVETMAPVLSMATVDGTVLTLTYDEELDTGSVPAASAFSVTVNAEAAVNPTNVAVAGSEVTLTLATAVLPESSVTLVYTVPATNPIQDKAGNPAAALPGEAVVTDLTPPVLSSAEVEGTTLTLTYDEDLDDASLPAGSAFVVTVNSDTTVSGTAVSIMDTVVTVTLAEPVLFGSTATLAYTPDANPVRDEVGNPAAALSGHSITILDTTPPTLASAWVRGTALMLTFDEALDEASVPATSVFAVQVDGTAVSLAATDPVAISGATVTLTLAEAIERADQTIAVSYVEPALNPLRDLAGNLALEFTNQSVDNRTVLSDDATLSALTAATGGEALALMPDFAPDVTAYAVTLGTNLTSAAVTATVNEVFATLAGSLNRPGMAAEALSMTSGMAVTLTNLAVGDNVLTITVTAENGSTQDYTLTLTVTRVEPPRIGPLQGWLARFGRMAAEQAVDGIAARIRAPRNPGFRGRLAGQPLAFDAAGGAGAGSWGDPAAYRDPAAGLDSGGAGFGATGQSWSQSRTMTAREVLLGSSFNLTGSRDAAGGSFAVWGRAAQTRFNDREDDGYDLDGTVTSQLLGADYARGRWTAGLTLMHSRGDGGYAGTGALAAATGEIESSLTAAMPWVAWQPVEWLELWSTAGYGSGTTTLKPDGGVALEADMDWRMAAAGLRGGLLGPDVLGIDGAELALVTDAMWARTASDRAGDLAATQSNATRLRLGLEGSWTLSSPGGLHLVPRLALGARHDGGDAGTGTGFEVGGGVVWRDPAGVSIEIEGRTLVANGASGRKETGYAAALAFDPAPASARGPSLALRQDWGDRANGGIAALFDSGSFNQPLGAAAATGGAAQQGRWTVEAAWGFAAFGGRFAAGPHVGVGLSATARDYSLGWRLSPEGATAPNFSIGLTTTHRESLDADPDHRIALEATARW